MSHNPTWGEVIQMVIETKEIIRDLQITRIGDSVKPDSKKRVVLPTALVRENVIYHVYHTRSGQIILDPQVTIPASEAWLFKNPEALKSVRRGISNVKHGKVSKIDLDTL